MDSGAVKELSMKSSKCHPNPLKPEGKQPVAKIMKNEMVENMKNNYLKEVSIQEELKKLKIENYLEFFDEARYEFYKCSGCFGPQLGHIIQKCTKLKYESDTVKEFEIYLKKIGGFKEVIWRREKEKETEREKIRAKEMVDAAAAAAAAQTGTTGTAGTAGVAQIVKPRQPPTWTGQQFDRWKVEIMNWRDNGRGNEEEKFLYFIESLKKNEAIKVFGD